MNSLKKTLYMSGGLLMGAMVTEGQLNPIAAGLIVIAVCNVPVTTWWEKLRCRWRDLTPAEETDLEEAIEQHFLAEKLRDKTPAFQKWSQIADIATRRFHVVGSFGGMAVHNPTGSRALRGLFMEMGKKLDLAVDRAWAEAPSAEIISRARMVEATDAAQNEADK